MDTEDQTSLLVDYLHDRLDAEQRSKVDTRLAADPLARSELQVLSMVRTTATAPAALLSSVDHGFDALMARIRAEERAGEPITAKTTNPSPGSPQPGPSRLTQWIAALFAPRLSYALAASVFVAQFAVLAVMQQRGAQEAPFSELRTQPTVPPSAGPFIRASLKPDATESDIRFLLISVGATIVGGPTQLGDYFLYVSPERADWAAQQMRQSPITDRVNVIATLPPLKD